MPQKCPKMREYVSKKLWHYLDRWGVEQKKINFINEEKLIQ